jgi:hypothetical protein
MWARCFLHGACRKSGSAWPIDPAVPQFKYSICNHQVTFPSTWLTDLSTSVCFIGQNFFPMGKSPRLLAYPPSVSKYDAHNVWIKLNFLKFNQLYKKVLDFIIPN